MPLADLQFPRKLEILFKPKRYKVLYGGRGGAKSWGVARALLALAGNKKLRIGCFREIQNSIKESVHKLLSDQINLMGLAGEFSITDRSITAKRTGSEFLFEGLFRNVNRIKSLEGIDIAWIEEAEKVSDESLDILIPTIRKDNSEIWVCFNTQFEDDPVYRRLVAHPPEEAYVVNINYDDNPWFPEVLKKEMESDKARDFRKYEHVWLGKPLGSGRQVWSVFDRVRHIREFPMEQIADRATCYMAMDPHSHYYPFCVWVAIMPKNERRKWPEDFYKHIYAEWPTFEDLGGYYHDLRGKLFYKDSLADLAREINATDGAQYGIEIQSRFIDPRFAKGSGSWNWSTDTQGIVDLFAKKENGGLLFVGPDIKILDSQRQVIHGDMLYNSNIPHSAHNEPAFSVSARCKNVIASLTNHRLEDDNEKEAEKYKDPSDTIRICWAGFSGIGHRPKTLAVVAQGKSPFRHKMGFA